MRSPMDESTFLEFYKNTVNGCSKEVKSFICKRLENEQRISFDNQCTADSTNSVMHFDNKKELAKIITRTAGNKEFAGFYESWEFFKLYKYSVPLFYESQEGISVKELLMQKGVQLFDEKSYEPEMILDASLKEASPIYCEKDGAVLLKFVLQKSYFVPDTYERIDYRYPIVIYFDIDNSALEIRYDSEKYKVNGVGNKDRYEQYVAECVSWLRENLELELFTCGHRDTIQVINDEQYEDVKIYKQMMVLKTGASAELTASKSEDYVLPFIGEIMQLIMENEEVFDQAPDCKNLLLDYLSDKEDTTNFPYIYVKWVKPVEAQSYIVKITFDYINPNCTLLQHITGNCKDFGMERMNNAVKYLLRSNAFVKGEKIQY